MTDDFSRARSLFAETVALRRRLHQNAEVGLSLPKTRAILASALRSVGLSPKDLGHSLIAEIGSGNRTVLLRADCDALPIWEQSGEPFASQNGNCHACGHDMHAAMLLCAARVLKETEHTLGGRVICLFQAGEESLNGARDALSHHLLEKYRPHCALALHTAAGSIPCGKVFFNAGGAMMSSADRFRIEILGKGGHSAYPNRAIDPIAVAVRLHTALDSLVAREADPSASRALTIGMLRAGNAPGVIPSHAVMEGALHTKDEALRAHLCKRIRTLAHATAKASGARAIFRQTASVPPLVCDPALTRTILSLLPTALEAIPDMSASASEDFALIASRIPSVMLYLSAGFSDKRGAFTAHDPRVRFNEQVLPIGAAIYARAARALLVRE